MMNYSKRYKKIISAILTSALIPFMLNSLPLDFGINVWIKILLAFCVCVFTFAIIILLFTFLIWFYKRYIFRFVDSIVSFDTIEEEIDDRIHILEQLFERYKRSENDGEKNYYKYKINNSIDFIKQRIYVYNIKIDKKIEKKTNNSKYKHLKEYLRIAKDYMYSNSEIN